MSVTVWHYPSCSTCRKALGWLAARGVAVDKRDIVAAPPTAAKLRDLLRRSGLPIARFFNTSGERYRAGGFKDRLKTMSEADALAALGADGKLIKRPLVDAGDQVLVGFDEAAYAACFDRAAVSGDRARNRDGVGTMSQTRTPSGPTRPAPSGRARPRG